MLGNNTSLPTVQIGAGIPLQSSSAVINPTAISQPGLIAQSAIPQASVLPVQQPLMAQTTIPQASILPTQQPLVAQSSVPQMNMAPQTAGSMLSVPPGTMVPVRVGNSIVMAPTQPVQTQTVTQTTIPQPPPQPEYQIESYQPPVETDYVPQGQNIVPAPQLQQLPKPTVRTLQPKIVKNVLSPQYKTVTLPAKVVTQRLPPIGPPPTPELNIPLPPPTLPPVETYVPPEPVQTYQSVQTVPVQPVQSVQQVQTVMVPQVKTVMVPQVKTVMVPQTQLSTLPQYQTNSVPMVSTVGQLSQPKYGSTSVIAQY